MKLVRDGLAKNPVELIGPKHDGVHGEAPEHGREMDPTVEEAVGDRVDPTQWHRARIESILYRPGTEKWAWEAQLKLENGRVHRATIRLVKNFYDHEAHRRIPKEWPFG